MIQNTVKLGMLAIGAAGATMVESVKTEQAGNVSAALWYHVVISLIVLGFLIWVVFMLGGESSTTRRIGEDVSQIANDVKEMRKEWAQFHEDFEKHKVTPHAAAHGSEHHK